MLGNVFLLSCFFVLFFAMVSVQLWKGTFRFGCYNSAGDLYVPPHGFGYVCGMTCCSCVY